MQITIDIPNGKVAEYGQYFLARNPKPADFLGSNAEWVKEWLVRQLKDAIKAGKRKTDAEAGATVADDIT